LCNLLLQEIQTASAYSQGFFLYQCSKYKTRPN
jgi:hypothetical protein